MVTSSSTMPVERFAVLAVFITLVTYFATMKPVEPGMNLSAAEGRTFPGHVLVTGGAGFIGSHATMRLLEDGYAVTIIDNFSRGNHGAVQVLRGLAPHGKLRVVDGDLGVRDDVERAFAPHPVDVVIHFAAIAFVGESMAQPLQYYHNITGNTVLLLETMQKFGVNKLVYSSTCATYGNPEVLPITEKTPTVPINPYGKSKLYAEDAIRDFAHANPKFDAAILRYFNVFGSDPEGRLGELPRAELRSHGRISTACFDAALGLIPELKVMGTNFRTRDGTAIRDFVHVTDLVDAHIAVVGRVANPPVLYNVGTGKGVSVREFVESCKRVTGVSIAVAEQVDARPGDYAEVFADVSKIQEELGWTAKFVSLDESLGHAWSWRKTHKTEY
uniref:UDP-glucose 4-epimerase n=1 Tax=Mantoniella antarctica TaxID=81844 RepID=A0A7S0SPV4_9CHLO